MRLQQYIKEDLISESILSFDDEIKLKIHLNPSCTFQNLMKFIKGKIQGLQNLKLDTVKVDDGKAIIYVKTKLEDKKLEFNELVNLVKEYGKKVGLQMNTVG